MTGPVPIDTGRHARLTRQRGFTLVEILVSLSILALVLPAVLFALSNTARDRGGADAAMTAAYLLHDKMSELEARGVPQVGEDQGEFEAGARYAWATSVSETDVEGLVDVVVSVQWVESGIQRQYSARTYFADPAIDRTAESQGQQAAQN